MKSNKQKNIGWVRGVTTNPILLKRAGLPAETALEQLARIGIGPLYYQLVSKDLKSMLAEAQAARQIVGERPGIENSTHRRWVSASYL